MTEEQKLETIQKILGQGAQIHQINFGDGTQNFYLGKEKQRPTDPINRTASDAEIIEEVNHDQNTKPIYPFITIPSLTDSIISKLLSYLQGKENSQPKDIMKPIRAAQDAGVIRRITPEEMKVAFPDYCSASRSSVIKYTKEDETPYIDEAFKNMVEEFKALK